ncbi:MAG: zinc ribbon domain-containing protein, partial [Acidobacteriota bacterium]
MKHCQQCNLDFPGSYRFCGSCGGALSDSTRCPGCGELTEARWTFCTNCGGQLLSRSKGDRAVQSDSPSPVRTSAGPPSSFSPVTSPAQPETTHAFEHQSNNGGLHEWYAAPDLFDETTQTTAAPIVRQELVPPTTIAVPSVAAHPHAGNGKTAPTLTMLAAYGKPEADPPELQSRHALLLGLLFLVFVAVLGVGGWYWWTHRASAAQSPPRIESTTAPGAADSSSSSSSTSAATIASEQSLASNAADEEWKRLREQRINAKPSDSDAVIASLNDAEKKY